jgi:murein DD-endopeptidase MepM/ murein hydrolase activator NlpD
VTIVVLADETSPAQTMHVSRSIIAVVAVMTAVALVGSAMLIVQCASLRERVAAQRTDHGLSVDWSAVRATVDGLEQGMGEVRTLGHALRVTLGLALPPDSSAPVAQGGADPESRGALQSLLHQPDGLVAWARGEIAALDAEIGLRERGFRSLQTFLDRRTALLAATPTILPVKGWLSTPFGYRASPFTGAREFHEGIDVAAGSGTPIRVTAAGTVRFAGGLGTYGNVVVVDHGYGFTTLYAHNSANRVRAWQHVDRGEVIAYVGSTGRTTGPHVHYEVHVQGVPADPLRYAIDTSGVWVADAPRKGGSS